jgi:hypothetical protein
MNQPFKTHYSSISSGAAAFLSSCGVKSKMQVHTNTQSYNRYAYCFNNPLKYTDPSGYTSYYVDGVQVSQTTYRMMGGAKFTSQAYGNYDFIANNQFEQKSLDRTIKVEPIFICVGDGRFGGDGLFHGSRNDASRTGLFGGMYNGTPFFTNTAESLSEDDEGYLTGLALAKGGYSISFNLMGSLVNSYFNNRKQQQDQISMNENHNRFGFVPLDKGQNWGAFQMGNYKSIISVRGNHKQITVQATYLNPPVIDATVVFSARASLVVNGNITKTQTLENGIAIFKLPSSQNISLIVNGGWNVYYDAGGAAVPVYCPLICPITLNFKDNFKLK